MQNIRLALEKNMLQPYKTGHLLASEWDALRRNTVCLSGKGNDDGYQSYALSSSLPPLDLQGAISSLSYQEGLAQGSPLSTLPTGAAAECQGPLIVTGGRDPSAFDSIPLTRKRMNVGGFNVSTAHLWSARLFLAL